MVFIRVSSCFSDQILEVAIVSEVGFFDDPDVRAQLGIYGFGDLGGETGFCDVRFLSLFLPLITLFNAMIQTVTHSRCAPAMRNTFIKYCRAFVLVCAGVLVVCPVITLVVVLPIMEDNTAQILRASCLQRIRDVCQHTVLVEFCISSLSSDCQNSPPHDNHLLAYISLQHALYKANNTKLLITTAPIENQDPRSCYCMHRIQRIEEAVRYFHLGDYNRTLATLSACTAPALECHPSSTQPPVIQWPLADSNVILNNWCLVAAGLVQLLV